MQELIQLIQETLNIDLTIVDDTPLLSSGLVDSFGLVVLLGAIEDEYDVTLDEAELGADSFDTPAQMLDHIRMATTSS